MSRRKCQTRSAYRGRTSCKLRSRQPFRYKGGNRRYAGRRHPSGAGARVSDRRQDGSERPAAAPPVSLCDPWRWALNRGPCHYADFQGVWLPATLAPMSWLRSRSACAWFLTLALAAGFALHGVQAAHMKASTPVAAIQSSMLGGCECCDGCDENGIARSACSLLCASYIADALPAFEPRVIGTSFAYALTDIGGVSLKGLPDPFPPKDSRSELGAPIQPARSQSCLRRQHARLCTRTLRRGRGLHGTQDEIDVNPPCPDPEPEIFGSWTRAEPYRSRSGVRLQVSDLSPHHGPP